LWEIQVGGTRKFMKLGGNDNAWHQKKSQASVQFHKHEN
jgi:hypothetical protein